jgi:hypothetical protein
VVSPHFVKTGKQTNQAFFAATKHFAVYVRWGGNQGLGLPQGRNFITILPVPLATENRY